MKGKRVFRVFGAPQAPKIFACGAKKPYFFSILAILGEKCIPPGGGGVVSVPGEKTFLIACSWGFQAYGLHKQQTSILVVSALLPDDWRIEFRSQTDCDVSISTCTNSRHNSPLVTKLSITRWGIVANGPQKTQFFSPAAGFQDRKTPFSDVLECLFYHFSLPFFFKIQIPSEKFLTNIPPCFKSPDSKGEVVN